MINVHYTAEPHVSRKELKTKVKVKLIPLLRLDTSGSAEDGEEAEAEEAGHRLPLVHPTRLQRQPDDHVLHAVRAGRQGLPAAW